ncbi:MAG: SDR family oxidoreductase [Clostridia bacterium]|nr:SDR family oxidoreductase [Clostridia bacterium]
MKNLVIVGASGEIGLDIAKRFYNKGYNVFAGYCSNPKPLENLIMKLNQKANRFCYEQINLKDEQSIKNFFNKAKAVFGNISCLINCAGVSHPNLLIDAKTEDVDDELLVNLRGAILATKHALPLMQDKNARIINIASIWGTNGGSCESTYSASKGGLLSFTKAIAKEMGRTGLTANCISPGLIKTKMNKHLSKEDYVSIASESALGHIATKQDISACALFLASNQAKSITGQNITIDAGWTI